MIVIKIFKKILNGIFGIVSNSNIDLEKINFDIKSFVKYSEVRYQIQLVFL